MFAKSKTVLVIETKNGILIFENDRAFSEFIKLPLNKNLPDDVTDFKYMPMFIESRE